MKPHIKYGLHTAAASILISLAYTLLMKNPLGGNFFLSLLVFAVAQYFALREWKHRLNGFLSFNKGFGYAVLTALIGAGIYAVFTYLNLKFLSHTTWMDFKNEFIGQLMSQPIPQGVTPKQYEGYMKLFISPGAIAIAGIFVNMIVGTMTGIFVALALRQEDPFKNEGNF